MFLAQKDPGPGDHSNEPLGTTTNSMELSESLRSQQLLGHWRISQHCMEPESLLMCSQEPVTGSHPDPYESSPHHPIVTVVHLRAQVSVALGATYNSSLFGGHKDRPRVGRHL
jgi:hypothetical protein